MPIRTKPAGSVWPFNKPVPGRRSAAAGAEVPPPYQALLFDFDIAGDQLKTTHRWWLDSQVVEPLRQVKARSIDLFYEIVIEGRASKPGPPVSNMKLSKRRARNVAAHLRRQLHGGLANITDDGVGESKATANDYIGYPVDRAVWVEVFPGRAPGRSKPLSTTREPPRLISERANQPEKPFQLRVMDFSSSGFSVGPGGGLFGIGGGISKSTAVFQICDIEANRSGFYIAELQGRTLSLGPPVSGDVAGQGPWNRFDAPRDVSLKEFAGPVRLTSWGIAFVFDSKGGTKLEFGAPKSWFAMKPRFEIESLETGATRGLPSLGVSDSLGTMKLVETRGGCD